MVVILIGAALIAFGVYRFRDERIPDDAVRVRGTVVDVRSRRSATRRKRMLHGAVVAFDHPETGRREEHEPTSFKERRPERGETVEIAYDSDRDRSMLVPKRPWMEALAIPAFGAVLIVLQIVDWGR